MVAGPEQADALALPAPIKNLLTELVREKHAGLKSFLCCTSAQIFIVKKIALNYTPCFCLYTGLHLSAISRRLVTVRPAVFRPLLRKQQHAAILNFLRNYDAEKCNGL
jgi:hypothetical protein